MKILLVVFVLAVATACDRQETVAEPSETVPSERADETALQPPVESDALAAVFDRYNDALKRGDYETSYGLVSSADRAAKSLDAYRDAASHRLQAAINATRTHAVKEVKIEGDTAQLSVETRGPRVAKIQRTLLLEYRKRGEELPGKDVLEQEIIDRLAAPDVPTGIVEREVFMVRDEDGWRLDFDWDAEHPRRGLPVLKRERDAGTAR